jgi:hypothetical protein
LENVIVSNKTRWIAALTGCLTAITGLPVLGYLSVLASTLLIVGAVLVARFQRHGRDLIWFGAGATTLWAIPAGLGIRRLSLSGGSDPRVVEAAIATVLLVVVCDIALITDGLRASRGLWKRI